MNKFISFFNFKFLKKVDEYLLLNHTLLWNIRLHYILFYSLIVTSILAFIYPLLSPEKVEAVSQLLFLLILLFYILWVYSQKDFISIKEYGKIRFYAYKEFFIYSISTIIFFMPIIMIAVLFFNTFDNYIVGEELNSYTFDKNTTYINFCDESNILCTKDREIKKSLINLVSYINTKEVNTFEDIQITKDKTSGIFTRINIIIFIIFFIPTQIILIRYGGFKNYSFMIIFFIIYFIVFSGMMAFIDLKNPSSFNVYLYYICGLFIIFFLFIRYKFIIISNILFSSMLLYPLFNSKFSFTIYPLWLFLGILFQFFILGLISNYLVYLISQPKN